MKNENDGFRNRKFALRFSTACFALSFVVIDYTINKHNVASVLLLPSVVALVAWGVFATLSAFRKLPKWLTPRTPFDPLSKILIIGSSFFLYLIITIVRLQKYYT